MGPGLHRGLAGHHGLARRRNLDRLLPHLGYDVTTWDGFEVLRDIRELRMTTMTAQVGEKDPTTRGRAAHRVACFHGRNGPRPWDGWRTCRDRAASVFECLSSGISRGEHETTLARVIIATVKKFARALPRRARKQFSAATWERRRAESKVWLSEHRSILGWIAAFFGVLSAGIVVIAFLVSVAPYWVGNEELIPLRGKTRIDATNAIRQILLTSAGGAVTIAALFITSRTFFLNRRGQIVERYRSSVAQLASDKLDERIGGVYGLQHVMQESPRDHDTVVQVLSSFIREHSHEPIGRVLGQGHRAHAWSQSKRTTGRSVELRKPVVGPRRGESRADIQAAISVLGNRPVRRERSPLDLRAAVLTGADLDGARLRGSRLDDADLSDATLYQADLSEARMQGTSLAGAGLFQANMRGVEANAADFHMGNLRHVDLRGSILAGADFSGAKLIGARLERTVLLHVEFHNADIRGASFTPGQLEWYRRAEEVMRSEQATLSDVLSEFLDSVDAGERRFPDPKN